MSDKLTAIKIKYPNGTYSEQILLSVLAENVQINSNTTLSDALDLIDARIDQIVAPTGSTSALDAEIFDARIGIDGTNHGNLGDAIRNQINGLETLTNNEISDLKNTLVDITGNSMFSITETNKYINLSGSTANINSPVSSNSSQYIVTECVAGDVFTITTHGGSSGRAYGFLNASGTVLQVAPASTNYDETVLTAPTNSAYFVVNGYNFKPVVYKNVLIKNNVNELKNNLAPIFSASVDYDANQYVMYNNKIYRFKANHPAGEWTSTDVELATTTNGWSDLRPLALAPIKIPAISNVDLNSFTIIGNYRVTSVSNARTISNLPSENPQGGRLINMATTSNGTSMQFYIMNVSTGNIIYYRNKSGDNWSSWQRLLTNNNIDEIINDAIMVAEETAW